MKNFCSISDVNFYHKISALNQSLLKYNSDYKLHLLCIDDQIYNKMLYKKNVICYRLTDLLKKDKIFSQSQNNPPSREAIINAQGNRTKAERLQFIWTLSPYFTWWCLENLEIDDLLYIDSDIYFFADYNKLYKHLEDCSVAVVEHRCPYNPDNGEYNVGIVYFKNDYDGYRCCTWWKNCLLLTNHEFYVSHGTCGDQKYLELFPKLFAKVKVLDPFIGHLAPWNFLYHSYEGDKIIWKNQKQELLYCHFSNFKTLDEGGYSLARRHGLPTPPNNFVKKIADEYYNCLMETKND